MSTATPPTDRRAVWSWAFYDWANSAFATTVMAGFFPVFYGGYFRAGEAAQVSTTELGFANTAASIVVALMAPAMGAIADVGGARKGLLVFFTLLGALATAMLGLFAQEQWQWALYAFILGCIGFNGALIFYDAMLVDVAPESQWDRVSSLGFGLGYLGGGLLFAVNVAMLLKPEMFGLGDKTGAVQASFLTVSVWWILFTIPLLLWVKSRRAGTGIPLGQAALRGIREAIGTAREIGRYRTVLLFIVAYMLYIDGVNTVIRMATKFGKDLGFEASTLMTALLLTQFVAFPAALAFGRLGTRIGPQRAILIGLGVYTVVTVGAMFMTTGWHFYVLAAIVGTVQGGVQSLSRSFFARLIPPEKAGEFFGFYKIRGKAAAIIGPTLVGLTAYFVSDLRYQFITLPLLFIGGGLLLMKVRTEDVRGV